MPRSLDIYEVAKKLGLVVFTNASDIGYRQWVWKHDDPSRKLFTDTEVMDLWRESEATWAPQKMLIEPGDAPVTIRLGLNKGGYIIEDHEGNVLMDTRRKPE